MTEEIMETNAQGGKAHRLKYDPHQIPADVQIELSKLLTEQAETHGDFNWYKLTVNEHLQHMQVHYLEFRKLESDPKHSVEKMFGEIMRVFARAMFATGVFIKNVKCENCEASDEQVQ